jgi:superfamily II DNA or RNA helicase
MPQGGFGNLIALPLQKASRDKGNSVFVNDNLDPWPDQWAFLASVRKLRTQDVEGVVEDAERRGRVLGVRLPPQEEGFEEPWSAPPSRRRTDTISAEGMPKELELTLGNQIYVAKEGLSAQLRNRILRVAAFQNPEFYRAQSMRLSTYDKPRVIGCAEDYPSYIGLPRGCLDELRETLADLSIAPTIRDERFAGQPLAVTFCGELRGDQQVAAHAMSAHDTGVLAATTAFGKTVVGAWLIAQRRVNTLVLVHRRQLLEQWIERLSTFLGIPTKAIGRIGGGRSRSTGTLDVAVIQSLVRKGVVDDRIAQYGHVIVDECHHLSAHSFELVARQAKARFVVGLSATVARKDGHHPIIFMQCGPVRHRVNARAQAATRPFEHYVLVQPTAFHSTKTIDADKRVAFQSLYQELIDDETRTRRICEDVLAAVKEGRSPLVLTERNDHLDRLEQHLASYVQHVVVLRAGLGKKQQRALKERLEGIALGEGRVVMATGRYVGEGFDDPRLDALFLTLPISWRGTVAQYAGRLHRLHDGKREVRIYDYADLNVPMLSRMQHSDWCGELTATKNGRIRFVGMTERLAAAIRQQRHLRSRRVLCKGDGTPLTRQGAWSRIRYAANRAKLPTGVHILRHTFCSHLAMQGAPMRGVQELVGHQSLAMTQRYSHLSPASRDTTIRLLENRPVHRAVGDSLETAKGRTP